MSAHYQDIVVTRHDPFILLITLNRPEARNALRNNVLKEIVEVLNLSKTDETIRVVVMTGGEKVFAAGADIKEMAALNAIDMLTDIRPQYWSEIAKYPKPIIAAVNGFALGGGCELVMHADIVIAGENAQFGQPEINLGIIPGAGGTQRLIRTVGKSLAMKLVLSGEMLDAKTALASGLVAEITLDEYTLSRALDLAKTIAAKPPLAVRLAKESMLKAFEVSLENGLNLERKAFTILAASEDRQEGIHAFMEKRKPNFTGR